MNHTGPTRKIKIMMILVAMSVLAAAAGCSGGSEKKSPEKEPAELTILFSNDLLGKIRSCGCNVEDTGGLARRSTYIRNVRESLRNLLVLDAGDAFSLDLGYTKNEAELTLESFGVMGMDVFTPGEMEFIFGLPFIQNLAENSGVDFVAAN
ncbi:MAG TPA: hypothetical protein VLA34_09260, partial [Candidatus Krumholzibacterium sp.]|nr:hypothetical protein [Candidatus Krumholzibacterium sp.]